MEKQTKYISKMYCMFVPEMNKNLLSISQINRTNKYIIQFEENQLKIFYKNKLFAVGYWNDGLYWLKTKQNQHQVNHISKQAPTTWTSI
jgi:hypothetical protein